MHILTGYFSLKTLVSLGILFWVLWQPCFFHSPSPFNPLPCYISLKKHPSLSLFLFYLRFPSAAFQHFRWMGGSG
jgi:hypothetical protein